MTGAPAVPSDEDLLEATARDPEAFGLFYRRHERRIVGYFFARTGEAEVAADLAAETFAAALVASRRFRRRKEPAAAWSDGRPVTSSGSSCATEPAGPLSGAPWR